MNEVTLEESTQVLNYYAKRASDLELQVLMLQAKTNTLNNHIKFVESENTKLKNESESLKSQVTTLQSEVDLLKEPVVKAKKTK